jgi:acyl carrier protein
MTVQITAQDLTALLDAGAGLKIPDTDLTPDTQLASLGIDSLALLGLTAEIERRYRVKLSAETGGSMSVADFLSSVNTQLVAVA